MAKVFHHKISTIIKKAFTSTLPGCCIMKIAKFPEREEVEANALALFTYIDRKNHKIYPDGRKK